MLSLMSVPFYHREVLEDECEQYRQDIAFLQSCLDGEHDFMVATLPERVKPPTLQGVFIGAYSTHGFGNHQKLVNGLLNILCKEWSTCCELYTAIW